MRETSYNCYLLFVLEIFLLNKLEFSHINITYISELLNVFTLLDKFIYKNIMVRLLLLEHLINLYLYSNAFLRHCIHHLKKISL